MFEEGLVNIKELVDKESLEKRLNKSYLYLENRGPDEKGMWHDSNAFFLHTRLKILDLKKYFFTTNGIWKLWAHAFNG